MKIIFNTQHVFSLCIAYMLSFLALLNCGNAILNFFGLQTQFDTLVMYSLLIGLVLMGFGLNIIVCNKHINKIDIFFVILFFGISFGVSTLLPSVNTKLFFTSWDDFFANPIYVLFLYSLPGYIFARQLENYTYFNCLMKKFSYVVVIISVFVFFFTEDSSSTQYMTLSYNMLTQLLFLIINKPAKYKIFHYGTVATGLFVVVFGGARGALLSLIIACMVYYFLSHKSIIKNVIICFWVVTTGVMFSFFKNNILFLISKALDSLSIDSRTFGLLLNEEFFNDSSRSILFELAIDNIGIWGKGIMSDRVILDIYPHNLFLELLIQFGLIVGMMIIIVICCIIIIGLMKKNRPEFIYIIIFLPCGFLKLMVTGSYLNQEPAFYILLGFCVNAVVRSNSYANTYAKHNLRNRKYRENC